MIVGGSPRPVTGPAGGGQGQGSRSTTSQNWQSTLRTTKRSGSASRGPSSGRGASAPRSGRSQGRAATPPARRPDKSADTTTVAVAEQPHYPLPPGHLPGFYDPYAGPHPSGYGADMPVEYDSFHAPHFTNQYPEGDFLYDRPVMYSDLPAYMPSYKDFKDRKARKMADFGREIPEKQGTRREVAEHMVPPQRHATRGYRPAHDRPIQPSHQVGAGWNGERSAQDVANSHAHSQYQLPERFEKSKHRVDWQNWTREESDRSMHRIRRQGDSQHNDDYLRDTAHGTRNPPGVRHNKITNATVQQSRSHGDVRMSTKPLRTL
eukprot:TRINITY_DN44121_c0_g1_i4.p2 TRINITY_DN44121_c0_g1~~TRINITY_DN44121_c0_g1_i4.p2  ORF type:complete len:320 (-),score=38.99 TRINITY_DN44121_c0_g1_i4:141-1100(-)